MEEVGRITEYIDVAQIALYLFWIFFAGLILYLLQEGKREGFPLDGYNDKQKFGVFFPPMPDQKTFLMPDGSERKAPDYKPDRRPIAGKGIFKDYDSPLDPTGDPMVDGLGPAAWAERADVPDMGLHGEPRIVPMRLAAGFDLAEGESDPRGMSVRAVDGEIVGTVADFWLDRMESLIRYLEVDLSDGSKRLVPMTLARLWRDDRRVDVKSITSAQFANVPVTKSMDQITLLEEDKISGYYAGGHFYATPDRREPFL